MTSTVDNATTAARDAYLAAVSDALAGVSESDRQDLLDDLAEHLDELAHEDDVDLVEQLGPPARYAADLLASAGIVPKISKPSALERMRRRVRGVVTRIDGSRFDKPRSFAVRLQPGWWVARAWLVLAAIAARNGLREAIWIPQVIGSSWGNVALLAGAIFLSVGIGQRMRWLSWIVTIIGVVALVSVGSADRGIDYVNSPYTDAPTGTQAVDGLGNPITNLFVYDTSGKPITRAFVFDQDGIPLDASNADEIRYAGAVYVPGLFPQPFVTYDENGRPHLQQPAARPVSVPKLDSTPTTIQKKATAGTKP